jgi:hypothetical protein
MLYGAGKSRIATIVDALRAINVPVRTVLDFDALANESELARLVVSLGGDWGQFQSDWKIVRSAIETRRPQLATADLKKEIDKVFAAIPGETVPPRSLEMLRDLTRRASAWSEAKKIGKAFIPHGDATAAFQRLAAGLTKIGCWIVDVGEIEGFCPSLGGHGPTFVAEVLQRDLAGDPELEGARRFASGLISGWN